MAQAHPAAVPWQQPSASTAAPSLVPMTMLSNSSYPPPTSATALSALAYPSGQGPSSAPPPPKPARRGRPPKATSTARGTKRKASSSAPGRPDPNQAYTSAPAGYPTPGPMPVTDVLTALAGAAALTASMLTAPTPVATSSEPGSPTDDLAHRNKPGRKPLNDVPATKRTAQNRASQRAFRERRQAHLADLEGKVKRYEVERGSIASQLALLAQRVRDETPRIHALEAALQARDNEIAQWRARCTDLSRALDALQAVVRPSPVTARSPLASHLTPSSQPPPPHQGWYAPDQRQDRFPAPSHGDEQATSPTSIASSSAQTPPSRGPDPQARMEMGAINMPSNLDAMGVGDALPPLGALTALLPSSTSSPPQDPAKSAAQSRDEEANGYECGFCAGDKAFCICTDNSPMAEVNFPPPSESLPAVQEPLDNEEDSGCGGCSKGGDCACRGDGIIDFDAGGNSDGPSPSETAVIPSPPDPNSSLSLAALATGTSLPLRRQRPDKEKDKQKLWAVDPSSLMNQPPVQPQTRTQPQPLPLPQAHEQGQVSATARVPAQARRTSLAPSSSSSSTTLQGRRSAADRAKLWSTTPECSGDPSTCAACGTDPELAAFCEAVNEDGASEASASSQREPSPSAPAAAPAPTESITEQEMSVAEAWRKIRSHPHFQEFTHDSKGGLHLLADVVAGRHSHHHGSPAPPSPAPRPSPPAASPARSAPPPSRAPARATAPAPPRPPDAARRASGLIALATLTRSSMGDRARTPSHPHEEQGHKRRRYVDNDGIRNALALLDRGALADVRPGRRDEP